MLDKRQGLSARIFLLHSKLATSLSVFLFLVCVTGTFSLLRDEIRTWEQAHHHAEQIADAHEFRFVPAEMQDKAITELLSHLYQTGTAFIESPIYVRLPYAQGDFAKVDYQPLLPNPVTKEREWQSVYLHPFAPTTRFNATDYYLSEVFYNIHHYLHLPNGEYLVGVATLFGLLIAVSGIVLAWKQRQRIFQRTTQSGTAAWRHWHRQIGALAFPVVIVIFFTGVILTLGIVFQASYALLLYDGDQKALRADAGYIRTVREPALDVSQPNNQLAYVDAMRFIAYRLRQARAELAPFQIKYIAAYNLHAQNAVLEVEGFGPDVFPHRKRIHIELVTGKVRYKTVATYDNDVRRTLELVHQLHFANFAGAWVKWVYLLLSMMLCVLIASGCLVWLSRFRKTRQVAEQTVKRWQSAVIGGLSAVLAACTFTIFSARILPTSDLLGYARGDLLLWIFSGVLLLVSAGSFIRTYQVARLSLHASQFTLLALLGFELLWLIHHVMQDTVVWMLVQDILLVNTAWGLLLIGVVTLKRALPSHFVPLK